MAVLSLDYQYFGTSFVPHRSRRKLKPMSGLRRGILRWLAYVPRFRRHFRNRRQLGQSVAEALKSARIRMRSYR